MIGGLVQQQQLGIGNQYTSQCQAGFLSAAKALRHLVGGQVIHAQGCQHRCGAPSVLCGHLDQSQQLVIALLMFGGGQPGGQFFQFSRQSGQIALHAGNETGNCFAGRIGEALGQVPDLQRGRDDVETTFIGFFKAHDDAHQRGFATPVGANQAQTITRIDGEIDFTEDGIETE